MKDKKDQIISLINFENKEEIAKEKKVVRRSKKKDNSKYAPLKKKLNFNFDYEINNVKFDPDHNGSLVFIKNKNDQPSIKPINFSDFNDSINFEYPYQEGYKLSLCEKIKFSLKRLVSQKKRRIETKDFNLDMSYITKRVIAMGFPSKGCETVYRNSLYELRRYFDMYHNKIKIYNLCLEKQRIYMREEFEGRPVALFPFSDHDPCSIKLMLQFCIDITLYFLRVSDSVAAIHCKAGKGRTGTMIICYMIFAGIYDDIDIAISHYASMRTLNEKGVTIESQKRYIRYFQNLLVTKFSKPYINCIPEMIKYCMRCELDFDKMKLTKNIPLSELDHLILMHNIITKLMEDDSYFFTYNFFEINFIELDNMTNKKIVNIEIESLFQKKIKYGKVKHEFVIYDEDDEEEVKNNELKKGHENFPQLQNENNISHISEVEKSSDFIKTDKKCDFSQRDRGETNSSYNDSMKEIPSIIKINRDNLKKQINDKEITNKFNLRINFTSSNKYRHSDLLGDNFKINHDIKIKVSSKEFQFYFWLNLWYSCLDSISLFIIENLIEKRNHHSGTYHFENDFKETYLKKSTCDVNYNINNNLNKEFDFEYVDNDNKCSKESEKEIHLQKKNYKIDSSNNLDCSRNIRYLKDLINRNHNMIEKMNSTEENKKNDLIEENKTNVNENNKIIGLNQNKIINFNSKAKKFINNSRKIFELSKINEILILLKDKDNLNLCISKLNANISELNEKGYNIPQFDKKNMELNLAIADTDKANYNKSQDERIVITLNYSLMNDN